MAFYAWIGSTWSTILPFSALLRRDRALHGGGAMKRIAETAIRVAYK
jgi:hypothetical protein